MKKVPLFALEARIKRELRSHLRSLGFERDKQGNLLPPSGDKSTVRTLHLAQRHAKIESEREFLLAAWSELGRHFANGNDIIPARIKPRLELIESETWQARLFRLASLTWSVPVSRGYGRRMRFLVWDDSNDKLIGLIALGDPVFNLSVRDTYIGWTAQQRCDRLVNMLDAYVLGAMPPYNLLLGGKLVAALVRSREVRKSFEDRYASARGIISRKRKRPALVMVTTTSALGRSSLYNRLRLDGKLIFRPLGFTQGWGHFHVPDATFELVREFLRRKRHSYATGFKFGDGPNWRLRAVRLALNLLGLRPELLCHGVKREVFACELATNATEVLSGRHKRPRYTDLLTVRDLGSLATDRWVVPRADRFPEFRLHDRTHILKSFWPQSSTQAISTKGRFSGSCAS
ncbi:MAG: hypothetical protein A49_06110 [Methyloceanibacter sp.]|nr:MAG: hypothetical protein A49_06110 [Methyloceanibacter sp.]